jgi:hypothetical protein
MENGGYKLAQIKTEAFTYMEGFSHIPRHAHPAAILQLKLMYASLPILQPNPYLQCSFL